MGTSSTCVCLVAVALTAGCGPDLDGFYRVESYALVEGSCTGAGIEVAREFSEFEIRQQEWAGVTVYPLYPCDGFDNCDTENHPTWNLVTVSEDADQVSMTVTYNHEDACILSAVELLIGEHGEPDRHAIMLEKRTSQIAIEPYVAAECTTDRAKSMRSRMQCVESLRIIGERALGDTASASQSR
jgi:hypothetical protein